MGLKELGLPRVRLVVSYDHLGMTKAAGRMIQGAFWQPCRAYSAFNLL